MPEETPTKVWRRNPRHREKTPAQIRQEQLAQKEQEDAEGQDG